jgi:hypothetical protein
VSHSALLSGGAPASSACISLLSSSPSFQSLAASEGAGIALRDAEDGVMLSSGIASAVAAGVLSEADRSSLPYTVLSVDGLAPADVAGRILSSLPPASSLGRLAVIVGLSGVGKGTAVAALRGELAKTRADGDGGRVLCWSNGNVFRALTMLLSLHMEKEGLTDLRAAAGDAGLKRELMGMLSFRVNPATGAHDTYIEGLGVAAWVRDIEVTELKGPLVSGRIPTVAEQTQGEVVRYVGGCIDQLVAAGTDVIVEGRAETLDFVKSESRFELRLEDNEVIGRRRAAQRVAGEYAKNPDEGNVQGRLEEIVKAMV